MRKSLIYLSFLLSTSLTSFGQSTIITGHFDSLTTKPKIVSIDVFNLLDEHPSSYLSFVNDKTGDFRLEFPHNKTQEIFLKSDKKLKVILSPRDSINIDFKKNGNVIFSGSNSTINQEIYFYDENKNWSRFEPKCEGKSVNQYKEELVVWIQNEKKNLLKFEVKYKPSKAFIQWANQDIVYRNANFLIDFAAFKQMNNQILEDGLMDASIFPVNKDSSLISSFYRAHLNQYLVFKYKFYDAIPKQQTEYRNFTGLQVKFNALLKNENLSKSRDIMIIDFFNMLLSVDKPNALNFINLNITSIKDKELNDLYRERLENLKTNIKPITLLSDNNLNSKIIENVFNDLTDRFKGKVIYLDFWATWCGPCRREFPYSHALANEFINKNVAFVYICMNSEIDKWQKAVLDMKLNQNQYCLSDAESKVVRQKFQIQGLPTYFLINRKGEIVDKEAPRPSDILTKTKIIELLDEK